MAVQTLLFGKTIFVDVSAVVTKMSTLPWYACGNAAMTQWWYWHFYFLPTCVNSTQKVMILTTRKKLFKANADSLLPKEEKKNFVAVMLLSTTLLLSRHAHMRIHKKGEAKGNKQSNEDKDKRWLWDVPSKFIIIIIVIITTMCKFLVFRRTH